MISQQARSGEVYSPSIRREGELLVSTSFFLFIAFRTYEMKAPSVAEKMQWLNTLESVRSINQTPALPVDASDNVIYWEAPKALVSFSFFL